MRLLLDTCVLLWLAAEPDRLSPLARGLVDDPDSDLVVSHAAVWEIALKSAAGKLALPVPPRAWLAEQHGVWGFDYLQVSLEHIFRTGEIPHHHVDPFDRLMICQAIVDGLTIVTPDGEFPRYPVHVIW